MSALHNEDARRGTRAGTRPGNETKPTVFAEGLGSRHAAKRTPQPSQDGNGIWEIAQDGDVVLVFQTEQGGNPESFRVDSGLLAQRSSYFARLLTDSRFAEGQAMEQKREMAHKSIKSSSGDLPQLEINDIGRTSSLKSPRSLLVDFLSLLHGQDSLHISNMPLINLTNLAIVSDRFAAIPSLASRLRHTRALSRFKGVPKFADEQSLRQRLLLGLLLGDADMVRTFSAELIMHGSILWSNSGSSLPSEALWWELPRRVEEELEFRRSCILQTIWSLVEHCLCLFTSKTRQCRFSYLHCDRFQLGELINFLIRTSYMRFTSTLSKPDDIPACRAHVADILAELRECPSYQLDAHHTHCGPRKVILKGAAYVESVLKSSDIGICYECLSTRNASTEPLWSEMKPPLVAKLPLEASHELRTRTSSHDQHRTLSDRRSHASELFLVREKLWNFH